MRMVLGSKAKPQKDPSDLALNLSRKSMHVINFIVVYGFTDLASAIELITSLSHDDSDHVVVHDHSR